MSTDETGKGSSAQAQAALDELLVKFKEAKKDPFVFLLLGRTGVGKSSTINSLMGNEVCAVNDFEPATATVESYKCEAFGVPFEVIDTPGLCDAPPEFGHDAHYLALIRNKVHAIDCMWFVSKLNDARVSADEKRGIRLISEAFGRDIWKHAVIVFTFAGAMQDKYLLALEARTDLIRQEIAKYTRQSVAQGIPSVAVDNKSRLTPDGHEWLGQLYTQVFTRMSERGITAFYLATASRIVVDDVITGRTYRATPPPTAAGSSSFGNAIQLTPQQVTEVKKRIDASIIGGLAITGAVIGSVFGPAGAVVGGAIGAGIGLIAWFRS